MLNPLACALESPQISQPLLELQKWWAIATKNQDAHLWGVVLAHVDNFPDYLYGVKAELKLLKSIAQAHRAAAIERGFTEQLLGSVDISSSPNQYSDKREEAQKILRFLFKP
jgi:hypothetical protein